MSQSRPTLFSDAENCRMKTFCVKHALIPIDTELGYGDISVRAEFTTGPDEPGSRAPDQRGPEIMRKKKGKISKIETNKGSDFALKKP